MDQSLQDPLPVSLGSMEGAVCDVLRIRVLLLIPDLADRLVHEILEVFAEGDELHPRSGGPLLALEGHDDLRALPDLCTDRQRVHRILDELEVGDTGVGTLHEITDRADHQVGGDVSGHRGDGVLHREDDADEGGLELLVILGDIGHGQENVRTGDPGPPGDVDELDLQILRHRNEEGAVIDAGFNPLRVECFSDVHIETHEGNLLRSTPNGSRPGHITRVRRRNRHPC